METRHKIVAGNWKMNSNLKSATQLADGIAKYAKADAKCKVVVIPPSCFIYPVSMNLEKNLSDVELGAQNLYYEDDGAFTGEISSNMLTDLNVKYVLVGHSERRHLFNESNMIVNQKLIKALKSGLSPILCVGETFDEREVGLADQVVKRQVVACLSGIENLENYQNIVIAYEPVWAIGTGQICQASEANRIIQLIRYALCQYFKSKGLDEEAGNKISILYGGSVKGNNCEEIALESDIDGALVGGASLNREEFCQIIKAFSNI